ncbi:MAG: integrase core domain-containing protein [Actinomycetia bacterium]|nr:integrase core domain-containing protein [Actinomycetes bacterium]
MDGRGRWVENVIIERWWRSPKSECLYINEYETQRELRRLIASYVDEYNNERIHETIGYATPAEAYYSAFKMAA